jgi:[protein-PII] uridylyltransferase
MIDDSTELLPLTVEPLAGLGLFVPDGAWGREARQYLARAREMLFARHQAGASGSAVVRAHTAVVDHVVRVMFEAAQRSYAEQYTVLDRRCALIAQGGYGRGELNPCSDLDLLVLYPRRPDAYVETVTERLLYALWDTGMTVGHALRSVRDCVRLANGDFKVKTSLLDTRFLAGDERLHVEFVTTMENEVLRRGVARFFREKIAENEERHAKYGDSVFLVEPHLKEGEGGLRDIHTAMWLAKVKFKIHSIAELVQKGVITERERSEIEAARDFLFRVRNALHFLSGQHQDQLTFEYQERIAAGIGFRDHERAKGVESFMRAYYLHAQAVNRFSDEIIRRCLEPSQPYRFIGRLASREIRPGVRIVAGELVVGDAETLRSDPAMLLRVFSDAQRHGVPIANATRRLIRSSARLLDESARSSPAAVSAFLDILRWKNGVHDALEEMHDLEVLDAFLPEFGALRCMAQYDRYHIYTVDEHILRGVRILERLRHGESKDTAPLLTAVAREIDKIEILYIAMLFHDAGKGLGGDHSNKGADLVRAFAERLGLHSDDVAELAFLVRHHLLMHHLATRRDIHDRKLVVEFARTVGRLETLRNLYVLTFGDLSATNPKLWNSWQDMLLGELYGLTVEVFERGLLVEQDQAERARRVRERVARAVGPKGGATLDRFLADLPDRYFLSTPEADIPAHVSMVRELEDEDLVTHVRHFPEREFTEFTVVTRDRPGLFAKLTGVLRASGMNIASAGISTGGSGTVIDVFRVSHIDRADITQSDERWQKVRAVLARVLAGEADVEAIVAAAARPSSLGEKFVPRFPSKVEIDNHVSESFTVIDVFTRDRIGILFTISRTLFQLGLSIHLAKITTAVDRVLDVFYVTDAEGRKIEGAEALERIRRTLLAALEPLDERPLAGKSAVPEAESRGDATAGG